MGMGSLAGGGELVPEPLLLPLPPCAPLPCKQGAGLHSCSIFNYIFNIIVFFPSSSSRSVQSPHRLCLFFLLKFIFVLNLLSPWSLCGLHADSTRTGGGLQSTDKMPCAEDISIMEILNNRTTEQPNM
jgi:hypothetical protein